MKYYKDTKNHVYAYEEDGTQDHLIGDKVAMTDEEVEAHINPPKTEAMILAEKVAEAKAYLSSTDFKMTSDYDEDVTEIKAKRATAREFIRINDVPNP